jgi:hypothetical protein
VTERPTHDTYWEVKLKSGHQVFDYIDSKEKAAWLRLADYIKNSGDSIVGMSFRLKKKVTTLPDNGAAYFFINKLISPGLKNTFHFYGVGSTKDRDFLRIMITFVCENGSSYRENRAREKCGFGLIFNPVE